MQVVISVGGRFHAFYLAQQLLKRGFLKQLITSYPKFEVIKYGIPKDKIGSVVIKEVIGRLWDKMPSYLKNSYNPQYLIHEIYDKWASYLYTNSDICVAFSSFGLHTIRKAKEEGAITILERGSAHMLYQTKILLEEYEKLGLKPQMSHPEIIKKELKEYDEVDYIAIPSLFVKRSFLEYGIPESKLIHVPYGANIEEFRQIPKEDNMFRVIYAGPMTLQKGIHYLLQAFYELKLPNSELMLVGRISNEIKPFFKKYEGRYKWIEHKPQRELYKYYSQGSVFVLNSIQDGFGMVMLQAMACGLPVICTTNTGGDDLIENGKEGFVIPIRDIDTLKEILLFLYKTPKQCNEMGQYAKRKVQRSYTWDDYGEKMIKEYERILNEKK